ncbi:MAG: ribosome silencing factor [Chlamydiales bacterium]
MPHDPQDLLNIIAQAIYDKKGVNILALDLRRLKTITDFVVIAEGSVDRHVIAIATAVEEALAKIGEKPSYVQGLEYGDWVVLDYMDLMIHLFAPGVREKYHLEELWKAGEIVELSINISSYGSAS